MRRGSGSSGGVGRWFGQRGIGGFVVAGAVGLGVCGGDGGVGLGARGGYDIRIYQASHQGAALISIDAHAQANGSM